MKCLLAPNPKIQNLVSIILPDEDEEDDDDDDDWDEEDLLGTPFG